MDIAVVTELREYLTFISVILIFGIALLIKVPLHVYFWLVIWSHYMELKENENKIDQAVWYPMATDVHGRRNNSCPTIPDISGDNFYRTYPDVPRNVYLTF